MALTNIETTIILDLYDHDTTPTKIKAIALDSKTRYVLASLRNNGNVYDAGQGTTVTLTVIRPDNVGVQITGETRQIVDLAPEGEVTVYGAYAELSQVALAIKGTLRAQFKLVSGEQILRTEIFTINNGEALDATIEEWAGELDGHNLDEMAQSIEDLSSDVSEIQEDVSDLKEGLTRIEAIIPILAGRGKTWAEIKQNVKMGYGEILYPVGTDFSVDCPTGAPYDSIVWTVVDHRVENNEHIMTMLMKHVIYGLQFDAPQAIIAPDETMAAGTYHFKLLSGYDTAYDGGKSVQFTLANDLAAGGQIVMNWPYNQTWIGKNITVYDEFGTTVIETCVMSEGTGGTDLGDADGTVSILNHTQRVRYGSNNYKESALRDWLNSDNLAGQWQTQQTRFQRPCGYAANRAGFVTYLDPEFVAVIREGTHLNRTNEIFDLNGKKQAYSTAEKFFLPSQEEIGFSSESGIVCGTVFDFYNGAAQSDKIKYDITAQTAAGNWWLRTPYPSSASIERYVYSSGALNSTSAYNGFGASAACEI